MIPGIPDVGFNWKKWAPWIIGALAISLIVSGLLGYSWKQTISLTKKELLLETGEKITLKQTIETLKTENRSLRESSERIGSRNVEHRKWNDQGILIDEMKDVSYLKDTKIKMMEEELDLLSVENDVLQKKVFQLNSEKTMAYDKETVKKDSLGINVGGEWDLSEQRFEWNAGLKRKMLDVLGLEFNLTLGVSQ